MRIVCPSCTAEYELPAVLEAVAHRPMRCARCAQVWTPVSPEAPQPTAAAEPVEPEPAGPQPPQGVAGEASRVDETAIIERLGSKVSAAPPARPPSRALVAAWALTLLVFSAAAVGAVVRRDVVMQAWPPAARAYQALGL